MFEALAINETTILGGILVLVVFSVLRFIDEIVDVLASLDGSPAPEGPDDSDS